MPFGLPGPTMISNVFRAATTGSVALPPASVSLAMFESSAEAYTSAGAPSLIWVTRSPDPAKLNVTFVPGLADSNAAPIAVNASVSDEAAKTTTEPATAEPEVLVCWASSPPHEAVAMPATATVARRRRRAVGMDGRLVTC